MSYINIHRPGWKNCRPLPNRQLQNQTSANDVARDPTAEPPSSVPGRFSSLVQSSAHGDSGALASLYRLHLGLTGSRALRIARGPLYFFERVVNPQAVKQVRVARSSIDWRLVKAAREGGGLEERHAGQQWGNLGRRWWRHEHHRRSSRSISSVRPGGDLAWRTPPNDIRVAWANLF